MQLCGSSKTVADKVPQCEQVWSVTMGNRVHNLIDRICSQKLEWETANCAYDDPSAVNLDAEVHFLSGPPVT